MIALASSRILELGGRLWKVCRQYDICKTAKMRGTIAPASTYIDVS